jgi:hypothetical protein
MFEKHGGKGESRKEKGERRNGWRDVIPHGTFSFLISPFSF